MSKPSAKQIDLYVTFRNVSDNGTFYVIGACTSECTHTAKEQKRRRTDQDYSPYRQSWSEHRELKSFSETGLRHARVKLIQGFAKFAQLQMDHLHVFTTDPLLITEHGDADVRAIEMLDDFFRGFAHPPTLSKPLNGISGRAIQINENYLDMAENDLTKREGGIKGYHRTPPSRLQHG